MNRFVFLLALLIPLAHADTMPQAAQRHVIKYGVSWTPIAGTATLHLYGNVNVQESTVTVNAQAGTAPIYVTEGITDLTITIVPTDPTQPTRHAEIIFNYPFAPIVFAPDPPANLLVAKL
jgi:hypothetical protein